MDLSPVAEHRPPWRGLAFVALAVSLIMLDTTIVNVALPWMAFDLAFTTSDTQWVVAAYSLSFAALLIVAGRTADLIGRRRLLIIGIFDLLTAGKIAVSEPAWQGFASGEIDVILENWGHEDLATQYITDQKVAVDGPIALRAPDNYTLDTSNATVDLRTQRLQSDSGVTGTVRQGRFSGDQLDADLEKRTVTLRGNARLRIDPASTR